jgi:hypothetical protein
MLGAGMSINPSHAPTPDQDGRRARYARSAWYGEDYLRRRGWGAGMLARAEHVVWAGRRWYREDVVRAWGPAAASPLEGLARLLRRLARARG